MSIRPWSPGFVISVDDKASTCIVKMHDGRLLELPLFGWDDPPSPQTWVVVDDAFAKAHGEEVEASST